MFKIIPVFKDYLWGGNKLREEYGKNCNLAKVAESWELSTHSAGENHIIVEGQEVGLLEYVKAGGKSVLGSKCKVEDQIPILIKLIDAKDNLSVQVHPDDEYAKSIENDLGKTEMWYVLEAEEGAQLVYGFKNDLTKEAFRTAIENNTLVDQLNYVDVHKGDTFFITPGTMHAIGKGIVIAEIQESSNVTYRVYDYGRVGADGKTRELHIDKALEVTKLEAAGESKVSYKVIEKEGCNESILASCEYFNVKHLTIKGSAAYEATEESFHSLLVVEGEISIEASNNEKLTAIKGDSIFIPANSGGYTISGSGEVILSSL